MKKEVQRLLEKADHALEVAESLYKQGFHQDASSKIYYAMFYSRPDTLALCSHCKNKLCSILDQSGILRIKRGKKYMARNETELLDKEKIAAFCRRNHIRKLSLFGSVLREDFGPESDVDVLVEFEPGHTPGFFRLFDMEEELSLLLDGRKVDLRTPEDLSRYFRDEVLAQSRVQYGQK